MKKGFTLIELIIVIIILGILAAIALSQYTKVVEKSRGVEARTILGDLRAAEVSYYYENGAYTATLGDLYIGASASCDSTHFFSYACTTAGLCTATRCTGTAGKTPGGVTAWTKSLAIDGTWSGTAGY
jgi:type IV pilus assembly protein PilE